MNSKFKGIYAANIVPLKTDKSIDAENLAKHVRDISNVIGIKGLLVNGHACGQRDGVGGIGKIYM